MGWMMGFDVNYLMLFCGAPAGLPEFVTDGAGHKPRWPWSPESSRFDYRGFLA